MDLSKREATIKDVATKAGVSISTASRAINGTVYVNPDTKERVVQAAKELGYYPNLIGKSLKSKSTNIIGLVIPDIRNPMYPIIVRGVEEKARSLGYVTCIFNTGECEQTEKEIFETLMSLRAAGVVMATGGTAQWGHDLYKKKGVQIVNLVRSNHAEQDCVLADNESGIAQAIDHLQARGYQNIALCKGPDYILPYQERAQAFRRIMEEKGLYRADSILEVDPLDTETADLQAVKNPYRCLKAYLQANPQVDAVICGTDLIALQCVRAAKELGRNIPDDLGVIGFDNVDLSAMMNPALTTVEQPLYQMGQYAVERLHQRLTGQVEHPIERFPTKLIVRQTT